MRQHQQSHIMACCATAIEHLRDIKRVVESGQSVDGRMFALLPDSERSELTRALDEIIHRVEQVTEQFAPEARSRSRQPLEQTATRMWLKVMLMFIRDQLRELVPETMGRRYGDLDTAEAGALRRQIQRLVDEVDRALGLLERSSLTCP